MAKKEKLDTFLEGIENNLNQYGYLIDPVRGELITIANKEEKELSDNQANENPDKQNLIELNWRELVKDGRITKNRAMELRRRHHATKKIKNKDIIFAYVKENWRG